MVRCLQCFGELKTIYLIKDSKNTAGYYISEEEFQRMKRKEILSKKSVIIEDECTNCGRVFPRKST